MKNSKFKILTTLIFNFAFLTLNLPVSAQVRPVYDYGANGLGQLLKRLPTTKSVMMIGAHPDDEDSALLALLARGENARTAYLSLTRGDGGQNIIGSELFESLGIIRTEELLQARRLDGAQQFFTRAFDFGFTKTLEETKQKWDERVVLCDVVQAIRKFRPLVVISRFSGTIADGHGQHQYSGYISPLAVRAAADANQCTDAGAIWQVQKFYVGQGFRSTQEPTLKINTGAYDFLLGRSYFEIAMEGRSLHRTQEQGNLEYKGDQFSGLNLVESKAAKVGVEKSVFDGIDVSITGIAKLADLPDDFRKAKLIDLQKSAENAVREFNVDNPQKTFGHLIAGLNILSQPQPIHGDDDFDEQPKSNEAPAAKNSIAAENQFSFILAEKRREFTEAVRRAMAIRIDAIADREAVAPGEDFLVAVRFFMPNEKNPRVLSVKLNAPKNWTVTKTNEPKRANQNAFRRETANETFYFNVEVPKNEKYTEPYWLSAERKSYLFDWQTNENRNQPFAPPLLTAELEISAENDTKITLASPIEYRFADDVRGELRRDLNVVPKIALSLDRKLLIVPASAKPQTRRIVLSLANNSSTAVGGEARLNTPKEIKVSPASKSFNLKNAGEKTSLAFDVTIPANFRAGNFEVGAQAVADGETFAQTMNTIAYPHIQTHRFYTNARTKVEVFDLKVAPARVGYVAGSGDEVAEAIRRMNLTVDLLNEADLQSGDLSRYAAIVVGIRAFQVRQDLVANNQRLLEYVKNGGNLIVQYQRPDYVAQNLQPFPASMTDTQKTAAGSTARVVDETAKVTILERAHPAFNSPNKITEKDFDGWVQERNLYNFTTFDAQYAPLLEAHDAGEAENKGGLVHAKINRGNYVYASYSFFRQLPAGNAGAYRLFANLLALPKNGERSKAN